LWYSYWPAVPVGYLSGTSRPPRPTLFPYTTLFRSQQVRALADRLEHLGGVVDVGEEHLDAEALGELVREAERHLVGVTCDHEATDRKSTRLNSSHVKISYAVFCLKKKSTRSGRSGA